MADICKQEYVFRANDAIIKLLRDYIDCFA
jgi:hypothetical protein